MKTTKTIALATALMFAWQGVWAEDDPSIESLYNKDSKRYEIVEAADLITLAEFVNSGNSCEDITFYVINNIEFGENDTFIPIGIGDEFEGHPFAGIIDTFDGQIMTIKNIKYSDPESVGVGLFGNIQNATIRNLKLISCNFNGNAYVGGIAGNSYLSEIENCHVDNNCNITLDGQDPCYVGGIVGNDIHGTITDCTSEATIIGTDFVGGIVGYATESTLEKCISSASITGNSAVGGIAGHTETTLDQSTNVYQYVYLTDCFYTGSTILEGEGKGAIIGARGGYFEDEPVYGSDICILNITLLNDDTNADIKNETRLANYDSQVCNVTLSGRTLYKDDKWNTLCLPFNLTINGSVLNGATVKELVSSDFSEGSLTLNFTEDDSNLSAIEAGKPYIIKWTGGDNLTGPVFESVTIKGTSAGSKTTDWVDFVATYSPEAIYENSEDKTCLYLGADNTLYYPSSEDVKVNSFRAYFKLKNELTVGEPKSDETEPESTETVNNIKAFVLNFGDEEMGIREISTPSNSSNSSNLWFTLDGRRLNGQPTQSGIFIHGGKKVILP